MAQIGSFTRSENGALVGQIRTLNLDVRVTMAPLTKDNDKAPDYRLSAPGVPDFGAAWTRNARETGAEYLSVKLDDPAFAAPIYATLVQGEKDEHKLIWSR